jgi:phosphatidate cytidylyltransferase
VENHVIPLQQQAADAGAEGSRAERGERNLLLRIISAAVLVPVALAAAYVGGWSFLLLCGLAAGGILWEWTRLVTGRSEPRLLAAGSAALLAAVVLVGIDAPAAAGAAIVAGAVLAALLALRGPAGQGAATRMLWAGGGVAYAGVGLLAPALLRRDPALGLTAFLFLAATVWMTDIFAYSAGRLAGGPLLWPRVSPNKTWAGAVGGTAGGVAGGTLVAYASGCGGLAALGVIALVLSVSAQVGDLLESAVKRRFGAKDSSHLIPGHGGLMDRLDGFLVAALAALLIGVVQGGTDAPARGLLVWCAR